MDDAIDSDRTATITHTVSNTGGYTNVTAASVAVTLTDNDTRGVTVSKNAVTVAENAGTATYTVVLDSQPTANVTLTPTSSATAEATVFRGADLHPDDVGYRPDRDRHRRPMMTTSPLPATPRLSGTRSAAATPA